MTTPEYKSMKPEEAVDHISTCWDLVPNTEAGCDVTLTLDREKIYKIIHAQKGGE